MNSMYEALKNMNIDVPEKPKKTDSKKSTIQTKLIEANKFIDRALYKESIINDAPDKQIFLDIQESLVLNYQRYTEAVKDLLDIIAYKEQLSGISVHRGLGELVRHTAPILGLSKNMSNAVGKLTDHNEDVHDYLNTVYYPADCKNHLMCWLIRS